jgi:hypothetical protein
MVLGALHSVLNNFSESEVRLHPEEVSLLSSKTEAKETLQRAGLELMDYSFGPQDLFVQAIVVGQK